MLNSTQITIAGNATADPELRFTPSGVAVASLNVAVNARKFNNVSKAWEDGDATFWRVNVWRDMAENLVESVRRGDRVIVVGRIETRTWENAEGEARSAIEIVADDVAASCAFATMRVTRVPRHTQPAAEDEQNEPTAAAAPAKRDPRRPSTRRPARTA